MTDTPQQMRKYLDISITLIVTLTLTIAMLWPLDQPPRTPDGMDKLFHFFSFACLAYPLASTGRVGLLPVFIGASLFGAVVEMIQPYFNRSAEINDWIADIIGVISGTACGFIYQHLKTKPSSGN